MKYFSVLDVKIGVHQHGLKATKQLLRLQQSEEQTNKKRNSSPKICHHVHNLKLLFQTCISFSSAEHNIYFEEHW